MSRKVSLMFVLCLVTSLSLHVKTSAWKRYKKKSPTITKYCHYGKEKSTLELRLLSNR